jgi:hypothetical protein
MPVIEIKPPELLPETGAPKIIPRSIFLAGSIEMGKAVDWQTAITTQIDDRFDSSPDDYFIFNPRRQTWDSSWKQSIDNPLFNEQVTWELDALDRAQVILMYLDPATKAPISMLELGLHATGGKMIVCSPEGFWRRGNVEIVCKRFSIPLYAELDRAMQRVLIRLSREHAASEW